MGTQVKLLLELILKLLMILPLIKRVGGRSMIQFLAKSEVVCLNLLNLFSLCLCSETLAKAIRLINVLVFPLKKINNPIIVYTNITLSIRSMRTSFPCFISPSLQDYSNKRLYYLILSGLESILALLLNKGMGKLD